MNTVMFKATDKQIAEMAALAVNASIPPPHSPGWFHYDPGIIFEAKDFFKLIKQQGNIFHLDYINGRCVKMILWRGKKRNEWMYLENEPQNNWQTWISEYKTYPDLMKAAGIELV